jgi:hypothetical protein
VRELEEAVLAGGAAANVVRDYQRKVQEMNVTNYPWLAAFLIKYELSQCFICSMILSG